ncbi:MAG: histidine phosphatase family protein [Candidatus Staskawiczbacteria bacterium]|nr:histidine phosphatase family protein [Candidatus Staskawiczbacteria bacterium]
MKLNNKYFLLRHGEAKSNVKDVVSSWPEKFKNPLTKNGKEKIKEEAEKLKAKNIDLIFASDLLRTEQTAEIVAKKLGLKVIFDKRLREIDVGIFNSKPVDEFVRYFKGPGLADIDRIKNKTPGGENYTEVVKRVFDFFKEINEKYRSKNILVVSHQAPLMLLRAKIIDASVLKDVEKLKKILQEKKVTKGELIELNPYKKEDDGNLLRRVKISEREFRQGKGKILKSLKDLI